ncbi:MAG: hypothetical protein LBB23_02130 [Rickettsiales bacterium]|nr:hypothetical protein [Rickettsiales bacterium]
MLYPAELRAQQPHFTSYIIKIKLKFLGRGIFSRQDPGVKHRDDIDHYPVRLRFATARHPSTLEGN